MNEYGRLAWSHWEKWLPNRLSLISESQREEFFTDLGEQAQSAIVDLQEALEAQTDLSGLDYLATVGRLRAIEQQAREEVLSEMVLLPPEDTEGPENLEGLDDEETPSHPLSAWMDEQGMPRDRNHRLWSMLEDDEVSTQEFAAASKAWEASLWQKLEQPAG